MNTNKRITAKNLTKISVITALYVVFTMCFPFLSYNSVQVRISEALCVLPIFYPEAIIGLTLGCFISNFIGYGIIDVIIGTISTFIASVLTYYIATLIKNSFLKFIIAGGFPIIINALTVPLTIYLVTQTEGVYIFNLLTVFLGEFLSVYVLGGLLYISLEKRKI